MDLEKTLYKLHKSFEKKIERFTVVKNYQVAILVFFIGIIVFDLSYSTEFGDSIIKHLESIVFLVIHIFLFSLIYYLLLKYHMKSRLDLKKSIYIFGIALIVVSSSITAQHLVRNFGLSIGIIIQIFIFLASMYSILTFLKVASNLSYGKTFGAIIVSSLLAELFNLIVIAPTFGIHY